MTNVEIDMRMCLVVLSLLLCPALLADTITTIENNVFQGVVSNFDKDKKLTLATGHGDLLFTVASDIKDAAITDYRWPKSAAQKKPTTDRKFDSWVKERIAAKAAATPKVGEWTSIAATREEGESDVAGLCKAVKTYDDIRRDEGKSVKEREKAFEDLKKLDGSWCYQSFSVKSVNKYDDELEVQFETLRWHDPTTGIEMGWCYRGFDARTGLMTEFEFNDFIPIRAKKGRTAQEVDDLNNPEAMKAGKRGEELFSDYDEVSEWKRGTGVIFRLQLAVGENGYNWILKPTRLRCLKEPKIKR